MLSGVTSFSGSSVPLHSPSAEPGLSRDDPQPRFYVPITIGAISGPTDRDSTNLFNTNGLGTTEGKREGGKRRSLLYNSTQGEQRCYKSETRVVLRPNLAHFLQRVVRLMPSSFAVRVLSQLSLVSVERIAARSAKANGSPSERALGTVGTPWDRSGGR